MSNYNSNYEIAQAISEKIGSAPIPFDSVYDISLQIYNELGGEPEQFETVYEILLGILNIVGGGIASKVIDDHLIATDKTWSSDKINSELSSKQDTLIAGDNVTISDNTISVTIPNVIDDSTTSNNKTWSSSKITAELANAGFSVEIVQELPVSGDVHTIYFVPETGGETGDAYDEYMYIDNAWEKVGSTRIDLSEYAKKLDYFIPLNMQTHETDWTVLNSAVNGVYRVAIGIEMAGQRIIAQQGVMTNVLNGNNRTQTIIITPIEPSAQGSPLQVHYRVTDKTGTQWYDYDYNLGIINDSVLSNPSTATDKAYSRAKVDDLLNNKQNTLTAGTGISISGDTISCTVQPTPALEAGQNVEIADNKINALGYNFNGKGFAEIPLFRTDAIQEFPYPLEQIGLNDLQLTGAAGATTYTMGGTSAAVMMAQFGAQFVQMGVMMKTANSEIAKIVSMDTTNSTITFESTLDANNALSNEVVTNLYLPKVILISGAAGATTYTYTSDKNPSFSVGDIVSFGDYPLVKIIGIDTSNNKITFDKTLDANNAVSNAQFKYSLKENNTASGSDSHAEGEYTTASAIASHAEGGETTASGIASHAEGRITTASGEFAHSEGFQTIAQNESEHAEGHYNVSHKISDTYGDAGNTQHTTGIGTGIKSRKNAFEIMQNGDMYVLDIGGYQGTDTKVQNASIKTLQQVIKGKQDTLTAGNNITINGSTISANDTTYSAGANIDITDNAIKAVGYRYNTTNGAFAEGDRDVVEGETTFIKSTATGLMSHAEGINTKATGRSSHAEGGYTIASGIQSHSEGTYTNASGDNSHTEGAATAASGLAAHSEGRQTISKNESEHAEGRYNVSHKISATYGNAGNTQHSIGIGASNLRKNAVEVMQNGEAYLLGVGGYDGVHIKGETGAPSGLKTLQEMVNGKQDTLTAGQNIVITNNTISAVIDAGFNVEVVQTLPETGEANTIYFVPKEGGSNPNVYDEYMYINSAWEKIGSTEVDLSNYYNKTEVNVLLEGKQDTLTAAENIHIANNTISALGYLYDEVHNSITNGQSCVTEGELSHAEGYQCVTEPTASFSHAEGVETIVKNTNEHSQGRYNVSHSVDASVTTHEGNTVVSVGIGEMDDRKNAFEIMQNGDIYVYGLGNYNGTLTKTDDPAIMTLQDILKTISEATGVDIGVLF